MQFSIFDCQFSISDRRDGQLNGLSVFHRGAGIAPALAGNNPKAGATPTSPFDNLRSAGYSVTA